MATVERTISVAATAASAWDAVRDFANLHIRLVPGFVIAARAERDPATGGEVRAITFFNGMTAREHLVTRDDARRRLVYGASGGRASHYNAAVQVFEDGPARSRIVWTIDLLPDELAGPIGAMADRAAEAMMTALA